MKKLLHDVAFTKSLTIGSSLAGLLSTRGIGECRSVRQGKRLCY